MTTSFQLTSSIDHLAIMASSAEKYKASKATGFCPQLTTDTCEMINETGGRL